MIKGYSIFPGGMAVYGFSICTEQEHIRRLDDSLFVEANSFVYFKDDIRFRPLDIKPLD